jgi:hypothetical protein
MLDGNRQLVAAYETAGMSPEDIAADFGLEVASVKLTLMNESPVYRRAYRKVDEDVSEAEMKEMFQVLMHVARNEIDHPGQRRKAAEFLINERKGRNDLAKGSQKNINVTIVDQRLKRAKLALERTTALPLKIEDKSLIEDDKVIEAACELAEAV